MATTEQHIAARNDVDLRERLIAAAEQAGIGNAAAWVAENIGALITANVAGESTIADVHAYAAGQYREAIEALPPAPGVNPAAVTDAYLAAAVGEVLS